MTFPRRSANKRCNPPSGIHNQHGVWMGRGQLDPCTAFAAYFLAINGPTITAGWNLCADCTVQVALWLDEKYKGAAEVTRRRL